MQRVRLSVRYGESSGCYEFMADQLIQDVVARAVLNVPPPVPKQGLGVLQMITEGRFRWLQLKRSISFYDLGSYVRATSLATQ